MADQYEYKGAGSVPLTLEDTVPLGGGNMMPSGGMSASASSSAASSTGDQLDSKMMEIKTGGIRMGSDPDHAWITPVALVVALVFFFKQKRK